MGKLLIVESPSKATTIQKYLKDKGFKVIASKGHIRDLPKKELGIDIKNNFELNDVTMEGKESVVSEIKKLAKEADEIYLASDPDREGEKISQSIYEILPKKGKKIYRVLFNSVTKEAIEKAIQNPGQIDDKKCEAQKVRRILDRLVGYKISPILWNKIQSGLSAGRVQSVALRIIVEREDAIKAFVPEKWFSVIAKLKKDDTTFTSEYFSKNLNKKETLSKKEDAEQILKDIENKEFEVKKVDKKDKVVNPTAPFTTSKMQQEASNKLGFDSKKTMQVAQKLYEGITLTSQKGVTQGLITYMRTDSVRVEPQAIDDVRKMIENKYGANYLPPSKIEHKNKKGDSKAQDAHEAVRPTKLEFEPSLIRGDLTSDEFKLYELIYNKFVASQMASCLQEQTTILFDCESHIFKTTGTVTKFDGFRKVFADSAEEKKVKKGEEEVDDKDASLPKMVENEKLPQTEKAKLLEKQSSPPPRFTEATLVKELEDKGIGRPSTYAAIISNITTRSYVGKDAKGKFSPTDVGDNLCRVLVSNFPKQMDIAFTASVEDALDDIEEGKKEWLLFVKDFWKDFESTLIFAQNNIVKTRKDDKETTGVKCLKCSDGEYIIRSGKNGEFLACSNYPVCTSTQNFEKSESGEIKITAPSFKKDYAKGKSCPKCGKRMVIIKGKNGKFLSCEDYPGCKTSLPMNSTGVKCVKCNKGEMVPKVSKNKNTFYGCSNYPECNHVYWDLPVSKECGKCKNPVMVKKEKNNELECPQCKNKEPLESKE